MAQNNSEWPIFSNSQLFQSFPAEVGQNGQFHMIRNFPNVFPLKWLRMTWNGQFRSIFNFSNLYPSKWLRMTWNSQFRLIRNFSNLFSTEVAQNDLEWPILHGQNKIHSDTREFL